MSQKVIKKLQLITTHSNYYLTSFQKFHVFLEKKDAHINLASNNIPLDLMLKKYIKQLDLPFLNIIFI